MSEQSSTESERPTHLGLLPAGYKTWNDYWTKEHNQPWRTEPEIDAERRHYLLSKQNIAMSYENGVYSFAYSGVRLARSDVEWLLASHESEGIVGPVDWSNERHRQRVGVNLQGADLRGVDLAKLPLARADLSGANVEQALFQEAHLEGASFYRGVGAGAVFHSARMYKANFVRSHFPRATFAGADLTEATFGGADLREADFSVSILKGANLPYALLGGVDMRRCQMDADTDLSHARLGDKSSGFAVVVDVKWGGANVAAVNWSVSAINWSMDEAPAPSVKVNRHVVQGDEKLARNPPSIGDIKIGFHYDLGTAIRAYRQLAAVLREQGLNEQADELLYRAQLLRKHVLYKERQWIPFLSSTLLNWLSGYGYRPRNAFISYSFTILVFTGLYLLNSHFVTPHLTWNEALVLSVSSFHGRGFFNPGIQLGDTFAQLAALEAFTGLIIEITFIATFTQRFFAR